MVDNTSSSKAKAKVDPSITIVIFLLFLGKLLKASLNFSLNSSLVGELRMIKSIKLRSIMLQDLPISIAVSYLSPVSTHILIPAFIKSFIVFGTSSWSKSSIAVLPK